MGGAVANLRIRVHVREKTYTVSCGDGGQRISWLANVGIVRYDDKTKGMELGPPRGVRLKNGTSLNVDDVVCVRLTDGEEVWVLLKEDLIRTETHQVDGGQATEVSYSTARNTPMSPRSYGTRSGAGTPAGMY